MKAVQRQNWKDLVPERSAGVWASYRFSAKPVTIGVGVRGQGRFFGNNANTLRLRGRTLLDAQASWRVGRGDLTVRGKNLADSFYAEWALSANQIVTGAPRTFEASYQFRF